MLAMHQARSSRSVPRRSAQESEVSTRCACRSPHAWICKQLPDAWRPRTTHGTRRTGYGQQQLGRIPARHVSTSDSSSRVPSVQRRQSPRWNCSSGDDQQRDGQRLHAAEHGDASPVPVDVKPASIACSDDRNNGQSIHSWKRWQRIFRSFSIRSW